DQAEIEVSGNFRENGRQVRGFDSKLDFYVLRQTSAAEVPFQAMHVTPGSLAGGLHRIGRSHVVRCGVNAMEEMQCCRVRGRVSERMTEGARRIVGEVSCQQDIAENKRIIGGG